MEAVLTPIGELGPNVSVAVYKLPTAVKESELVVGLVAQEPRLGSLMASEQARANSVRNEAGDCLLAIGGFMEPDVFAKVHGMLMCVDGVELLIGAGPGCSTLPKTALARAAVGAADRAKAKKPWWKVT